MKDKLKDKDLSVNLLGLYLKNPIIGASGTFGFGKEFKDLYPLDILGSFSTKGITQNPRFGNESPRIADCPAGMLNSIGLENPGIDRAAKLFSEIEKYFSGPVIANIGGFSVDEFETLAKRLDKIKNVGIIEVNISCPNLHKGGKNFGSDAKGAAMVTRAVKRATSKPVMVKLSPNVSDITEIARACEAEGADALSLINTLLGLRIDLAARKPVLKNKVGGYSGPGVFPVALRMVYEVYEAVKIPIVGMGGVADEYEVIEMMMAGATAVQIGAKNLVDPYAMKDIILRLPKAMERLGIDKLSDIIGAAH